MSPNGSSPAASPILAAPAQPQGEREAFEALLAEYWELAYDEGKTGRSHGSRANEVLAGIRASLRASPAVPVAQDEREALIREMCEAMRPFSARHNEWRGWPGTWAFANAALSVIERRAALSAATPPAAVPMSQKTQDGHSASPVAEAPTTPPPETTGTRLTGSVAVAINGMQFEPPWFLECVRGASYHIDRKVAQVDAYDLPPKSIPRDEFTGEQLRAAYEVCTASVRTTKREDGAGISPATPADANMGCACRWVGTEYVERCDFHDAWHTALHEWADRARTAEALLRELRSCSHHDPYAKKSWTNSQGRWVTANVPADLWGRIEAVASTGADTARHGQDDHAGSPAPSEPVAVVGSDFQLLWCRKDWSKGLRVGAKLYTHPAPSESSKAALSDEEILACNVECEDGPYTSHLIAAPDDELIAFARAILARAGIGESRHGLDIKALREALVASRVVQPEAVYDAEGYDGGVMLGRIEALHRSLGGIGESRREPQDDPCPQCERGGVCRTPSCGRLKSSELMSLYGGINKEQA